MKIQLMLAASLLSLSMGVANAADEHAGHAAAAAPVAAAGTMAMTAGEVRKVDPAQGKITLKHEAITNLDMPAMTMVFRVEPADLLKDLQAGDKVRFHAESTSGAIVVTHIQKDS